MNQHLSPDTLELQITRPVEQYFIVRGNREPFIDGDLMDRATVIAEVSSDCETLRQIIAFSLAAGTSRDATDDICGIVIQRWAEDGKLLTEKQKAFVAMCKGEAFANAFRLVEA